MREATRDGSIKVGARVLVKPDADEEASYWDTVRAVFDQQVLLQPYAANEEFEALVLTTRSWCRVSDVISFYGGEGT